MLGVRSCQPATFASLAPGCCAWSPDCLKLSQKQQLQVAASCISCKGGLLSGTSLAICLSGSLEDRAHGLLGALNGAEHRNFQILVPMSVVRWYRVSQQAVPEAVAGHLPGWSGGSSAVCCWRLSVAAFGVCQPCCRRHPQQGLRLPVAGSRLLASLF